MLLRTVLAGSLVLAAVVAQAPPGFKTYENKLSELVFYYPVVYQEVPVPPTEQTLVARYVLKDKPRELKKVDDRVYKAVEPQLYFYNFELPQAVTGARPADTAEDGKPTTVREAMEASSRVSSWEEFAKRFANWHLQEDAKNPGNFDMVFEGRWQIPDAKPVGRLVKLQEGNVIYGAYGFALSPYQKVFDRHFDKLAKGIELGDGADDASERASERIDRIYASGEYSAVELRKKARVEMARGWKAYDTPNYLIVHHSKNDGLIKRIGRDIEAMRSLYMELFPPTKPVDAVSIVRVCRTKEEYAQYGGPPGSGGYWHPGNEELVFYDYSYTMKTLDDDERKAMGKRKLTDDDSLLVLYHEAFHQYIFYAVGEFAPHDWFNEGYGDYFSGTDIGKSSGKVQGIDPSPWRIHLAKDMCEYGEGFVPLKEILNAERAVFYNRARIGFFYAGAWSFIYFLKQCPEVQSHPKWAALLQTYFDTAKAAYAEELAKLGENPDLSKKQVAQFMARKAALKAALDGVDLDELEKAWKKYVVEMKDPWPSQRKKHK
ncbi:MAG: hypothetical protein H6838_07990 [Planctomycetes bacterium]|nr:hypothetical protein [Planctomycetota bacterium]